MNHGYNDIIAFSQFISVIFSLSINVLYLFEHQQYIIIIIE